MYKTPDYDHEQLSFVNFNTTCGMQLDMNNEWIQIAKQLPWRAWESLYQVMFPFTTGNVAKPCRMALGSMIIQLRMGFTDRDLISQIQQNPYYQFFISKLVVFSARKGLLYVTYVSEIISIFCHGPSFIIPFTL
jgi:hypothetical protein